MKRNRPLLILILSALLLGLMPLHAGAATSEAYTDVSETDWYSLCVENVTARGLMNGTGGGTFTPGGDLTRAMLVTVLWRIAGEPQSENPTLFTDVPEGQWYSDAVAWAASNQVVEGYGNDIFGTNDPVTREQMAVIFYRWAQEQGYDTGYRRDLPAPDAHPWADEAVRWAKQRVLLPAFPLPPMENASRAEVAVFLDRFCLEFTDDPEIKPCLMVSKTNDAVVDLFAMDETGENTHDLVIWEEKPGKEGSQFLTWRLDTLRGMPSAYETASDLNQMGTQGGFHISAVYTVWGDPLAVTVYAPSGSRTVFLYYTSTDKRAALTSCGEDGGRLEREFPPEPILQIEYKPVIETLRQNPQVGLYCFFPEIGQGGGVPWEEYRGVWKAYENKMRQKCADFLAQSPAPLEEYNLSTYGIVMRNDGSFFSVRISGTDPMASSLEVVGGMTWLAKDFPTLGLRVGERLKLDTLFQTDMEHIKGVLRTYLEEAYPWNSRIASCLDGMEPEDFVLTQEELLLPNDAPVANDYFRIPLSYLAEQGLCLIGT